LANEPASADALSGLSPGDRTTQDHHRRVERQLADLLGVAFAMGDQGVVPLIELGAKRDDGGLNGCGVLGSPFGHRGVACLIHPDESGHLGLLETGDASLIVRPRRAFGQPKFDA
jgi:hypothetical protein